ncbi:SDR family oxidoreductase [Microlunatus speluncae]|uniref:SDR family oxidoreductase n=1 Tax=Microlunatus speluncae TaxID=2594267 RepID=UPI00126620C4|nr:SDR family oxidoreductase [Microlunatus speluncae]
MSEQGGRVALVTGSSRGVGAETVRGLVRRGFAAVINYRDKANRAEALAAELRAEGGSVLTVRADLTDGAAVGRMFEVITETFGRLDLVILNASGGMEREVAADYAMTLNRDAQLGVVEAAGRLMGPGGRIVFVTSHQAHFFRERAVPDAYRPVAESKLAGELALRELIPDLDHSGLRLTVVSGDMITDTITVKMLERAQPGTVAAREAGAGSLLTVQEFSCAIIAAALDDHSPTGHTIYVGGADYLHGPGIDGTEGPR